MASSTYGTYLMIKATYSSTDKKWTPSTSGTTTYTKLIDIKDFSDLGGEPETIETTTLSDKTQTNVLGVEAMGTLTFTANYSKSDMIKLDALEDGNDYDFEIWFSTKALSTTPAVADATEGRFTFSGQLRAYPLGKGVNEVREMQITISNSTSIKFEE